MKLIDLTCQKCGGNLKADIDNLHAYCPHCGQKLLFDLDQIEFVIAEREKTKREQEVTKRVQIEEEYKDRKSKRKYDADFKNKVIMVILMILLMLWSSNK